LAKLSPFDADQEVARAEAVLARLDAFERDAPRLDARGLSRWAGECHEAVAAASRLYWLGQPETAVARVLARAARSIEHWLSMSAENEEGTELLLTVLAFGDSATRTRLLNRPRVERSGGLDTYLGMLFSILRGQDVALRAEHMILLCSEPTASKSQAHFSRPLYEGVRAIHTGDALALQAALTALERYHLYAQKTHLRGSVRGVFNHAALPLLREALERNMHVEVGTAHAPLELVRIAREITC
jgi:hypothetical protein